ncbi:bacillithiol system protein YtxJ [Paenibacillus larvae subsp. larvae]|uniref:Bacillithiol system protein YtxJ n=1 Tax=Paenibacillus larvae subsp. larvae TaxID=147375 RepID=A0A2L1TZL1_9BACL|nr:bacillithiol system redox-active protein YtxJ [Paenibacillus larvae]AQT86493.1 general stress protein [Paenibacillus larvae subsp. pulvifaciens]AQZ48149.1 general stress protein [Paenibacillus larvae subsp. pulvifaciens]AVF26105.1 bacillithiol system protein YtxJ [Paenibacillus larvae subsp. larvae]AVF30883.1 bacillithiol system protein YtxJ [Paenibacillus larvae subsp. larvae]MBH0340938.1 general stress protein [Paenibacillus larvae]
MTAWKEISEIQEWNDLFAHSDEQPFVILKHSTTCPVSASALEEYEEYLSGRPNEQVKYYLVKVIESRPVSNRIAGDLKVKHESPQIIYVKDKASYWNTSHWSITKKHMAAVLD